MDGRSEEDQTPPLHIAHRIALRAAPYVLWTLALYLLVIGTLVADPGADAISTQVLGAVLAVAGAVVTRAKQLDVQKDGVKAEMTSIADLDREVVVTVRPNPDGEIETRSLESPTGMTVLQLVEAAEGAGWIVQRPRGERHLTMARTNVQPPSGSKRFGAGDSVTIHLPLATLSGQVPPHVAATMEATGFVMPSRK